jgi:TatA/E family protein of Tat protein translocase
MMGEFSLVHLIVVGLIILILFGSDKLPVFGQSLGKAIKGFKQGLNEIDVESKDVTNKKLTTQQQADLAAREHSENTDKNKV